MRPCAGSMPPGIACVRRAAGYAASADQAGVLRVDDPVTLARGTFEPRPVENGDDATAVANQARLLELAGHRADTGPAHAKHVGEELLGEGELVRVHSIVGQQQPASA